MKWNSRRVSAWAYAAPTDLRKGFDGLSALVLKELSRDPLSGDLYLFVSRNRIRSVPSRTADDIHDRALGAFLGLAVGDAVGTTRCFRHRVLLRRV